MKFSLIIPVAPERDAEIIESISELDYPKSEFHVIVVRGKNPSENRNKGAGRATGEIIAFLDDDAVVPEDFLKKADDFFERYPEIDIVGGPQLTPRDEKGFAKISGYALCSKFGAAGTSNRYARGRLNLNADEKSITSANLFVRKKVMEKIQFDPSLWPGEDPKFIDDAKKQGFKVAYYPNLVLYHRRRATINGFIKQIFNYGRVRPAKENFFETLKKPVFLVPSLFLVYLIVLIASVIINPSITGSFIGTTGKINWNFWFVLPLILYVLTAILFSIYEGIKNGDFMALFILPFIYLMIHLSYGAGLLTSYFKKPKDRRLV